MLLLLAAITSSQALKSSGRDSYYDLFKLGTYSGREDNTASCLTLISNLGFKLKAGVSDFWNARGVTYRMENRISILPILNDGTPFFYMSTLGPLKNSKHYGFDKYNFVIFHKNSIQDQFNFNSLTLGKFLPKPSKVYSCENSDKDIWLYNDESLDLFVKNKIDNFLSPNKKGGFEYLAKDLPSLTGRLENTIRKAIQN